MNELSISKDNKEILVSKAIQSYKTHLINLDRRPKTIKGYTEDLNQWRKWLEEKYNGPIYLSDLKAEDNNEFLLWLKQVRNYKPASRRRLATTITGFLKFVYKKHWISNDLALEVPRIQAPSTERSYLEPDQVMIWINEVSNPVVQIAMYIMFYGGLRISEVVSLKVDKVNITDDGGWLDIRNAKGGKHRMVPIAPKLAPILEDYLAKKIESEYLLAPKKNGSISIQTIQVEMREARRRLGWSENITPHTLRHSFASHVYQKTGDIISVQRLLGHSKLNTTQIYAHVNSEHLSNAVDIAFHA